MKKVLIIPLNGLGWEGISTVVYNYCNAMTKSDLCLFFLNSNENSFYDGEERFYSIGEVIRIADRKKSTKQYIKELNSVFRNNKFDVVHIHGNSSTMAIESILAKIHGVKKIIVHTHNTKTDHEILNRLLKPFMYATSDVLLACGKLAGEKLYGKKEFKVFNNAIDITKYSFDPNVRNTVRKELGIGSEFIIGNIGHFSEQKNQQFLIKVFKEFRNYGIPSKLLLVGNGDFEKQIKDLIDELDLKDNVILTGNRADTNRLYQAMDVFVLTSLWEGLPLVSIESQASGLPLVMSSCVTKEAKCSENVYYCALEDGEKKWADLLYTIYISGNNRLNNAKSLLTSGFDIMHESDKLQQLYEN